MTETATQSDLDATDAAVEDAAAGEAFIAPAAMENDLDELFPGDRGVLDPAVRRLFVHVLQRRFLMADRNREEWTVLLDNQQLIESRLNDLFVRLVVDHDRGVAYKQQVRSDEFEMPILLRDAAYTRSETLVLVHLRTVYQRESAAGEPAARVDIEDVEQTVMSYFVDADGDTARRQRSIRKAMDRLARDGIVDEETTGRFRISPLVEIVLSAEKLRELRDWLRTQSDPAVAGGAASVASVDVFDEAEDDDEDDLEEAAL
ncbi:MULTISPECIES: DUF4194 domain-containing protein [Microbacterium]|uniref:DUF4194 domain-containing protein n=1 Tax=Microbacterium trichothecenolyticum TaxID=69370 RepID=A0A0M2H7R8_MICTR|nr:MULTISPECIES: DUF4194 domain-containing protein [Microbacterium]KJL42565.1 hypothetical protein RS82_02122 [Microbacterium trichothecenolyticum]MDR7190318.1 hypothetical protein [Microbacterium sp. BE35]